MTRFILILLLISTAIWANDDAMCSIKVSGGVMEIKNPKHTYLTIQEDGMPESYFSVKQLYEGCKGISENEILNKSIIKNPKHLKFKNDRQYMIIAHLSPSDKKENFIFTLDSAHEYFTIKVLAKKGESNTHAKFMIKSEMDKDTVIHNKYANYCDMSGYHTTESHGYSEYITSIVATVNRKPVFDVATSPNIASNPAFKFQFKNIMDANKIKFNIENNKGLARIIEIPFKSTSVSMEENVSAELKTHSEITSKVFEADTVDKAIGEFYGEVNNPIENKIIILTPEVSVSSGSIPVEVKSNIELESLIVLSDKLLNPTIAIFNISSVGIVDYTFKIRVRDHKVSKHTLIVVGKGKDGKFYKSAIEANIVHSICE